MRRLRKDQKLFTEYRQIDHGAFFRYKMCIKSKGISKNTKIKTWKAEIRLVVTYICGNNVSDKEN